MQRTTPRAAACLIALVTAVMLIAGAPASTTAAPQHSSPNSSTSAPKTVPSTAVTQAVQLTLRSHGYSLAVDGVYGPVTRKAVIHWQRANGLTIDGVVGPETLSSLGLDGAQATAPASRVDPPKPQPGDVESALRAAGATDSEIAFAIPICQRESGCRLEAHNYNASTKDDSMGPWQINFWGSQERRLNNLGITRNSVRATWLSAAESFLILLRAVGRCAWTPPNYC